VQSDIVYKVQIGFGNILGFLTAQHTNHQSYQSFGDDGIAVGSENYIPLVIGFCMKLNATLAAFDEIFIGLVIVRYHIEVFARFDDVFVFVHPVIKKTKLLDDLLLFFFYTHTRAKLLIIRA